MDDQLRVDKWMWHVRIFKSRTIATDACKKGRIKCKEKTLKPSSLISVGDKLHISKEGFELEFIVEKIIRKRVGAPLAVECYQNVTPEEELNKFKSWFIGKASPERRDKGAGRPTKKERRTIEEFKADYLFDFDE